MNTDSILPFFEDHFGRHVTEEAAQAIVRFVQDLSEQEASKQLDLFSTCLEQFLSNIPEHGEEQCIDGELAIAVIDEVRKQQLQPDLPSPSEDQPSTEENDEKSNILNTVGNRLASIVERSAVSTLILDMTRIGTENGKYAEGLLRYDTPRKEWRRWTTPLPSLICSPQSMVQIFRQRWHLIHDILRRDFKIRWWDSDMSQPGTMPHRRELRTTEQLLGKVNTVCDVIGFLREANQNIISSKNGEVYTSWFLEDLTQMVEIDVSEESFYLDGHIVICTGVLDENRIFHVARMRHPCEIQNICDNLASPLTPLLKPVFSSMDREQCMQLQQDLSSAASETKDTIAASVLRQSWVIINGCKFDDEIVAERLKLLFQDNRDGSKISAYLQQPNDATMTLPSGFILMGDFSKAYSPDSFKDESILNHVLPTTSMWSLRNYRRFASYLPCWYNLYNILKGLPRLLKVCKFIFVPGPFDPGLPVLPRPRIPSPMTSFLASELQNVFPQAQIEFLGNPAKIVHPDGLRMMILRANTYSMYSDRRYALHTPRLEKLWPRPEELRDWTTNMLIGQSHAYPLPLPLRERLFHTATEFDSMLWLDPLPDLVVLGDITCPSWVWSHGNGENKKWIITAGSFAPNTHDNGTWIMYETQSRSIQIFNSSDLVG